MKHLFPKGSSTQSTISESPIINQDMPISKSLLDKPLESKYCRTCQQYTEHVGGTLCAGCSLEKEDIEWYIENIESEMTPEPSGDNKSQAQPEPPQPLSDVNAGDKLMLSNGLEAEATEVTSRSVKTASGQSFVKSDGTGWGSNDLDAAPLV